MFGNTTANLPWKKIPGIALLLVAMASIITVGFQAISHLREEAIRDSLLIRFRKL